MYEYLSRPDRYGEGEDDVPATRANKVGFILAWIVAALIMASLMGLLVGLARTVWGWAL